MKFYVITSSKRTVIEKFLKGDFYSEFEDAEGDLKEFGKPYHAVFSLDIPITQETPKRNGK